MNFMTMILDNTPLPDDKKLVNKIERLRNEFKKYKVKIDKKFTRIGSGMYYNNVLPYIPESRDVLKKPDGVCKIFVNWKNKPFSTTEEAVKVLKPQWGWCISVVDEEHTRNKFKNKDTIWAVFDSEVEAKRNLSIFNRLFMTAIEQDCVEEYKKFKCNPEKRPLTFDKLVDNAYELYEQVDNGEL